MSEYSNPIRKKHATHLKMSISSFKITKGHLKVIQGHLTKNGYINTKMHKIIHFLIKSELIEIQNWLSTLTTLETSTLHA